MDKKPVYIIAEAGVNHNGSMETARKLIDVAAEAGADAVKFQTFQAEKLVSKFSPKADYQIKSTDPKQSQLQMLKNLQLGESQHRELSAYCQSLNIAFISSPFDQESLKLLVNGLNVSCLKIATGEITNAPLLFQAGCTGKKIILSTGMSTLGEVELSLGILALAYIRPDEPPSLELCRQAYASVEGQSMLKEKVILLHCTTEYPAPLAEVNLYAMDTLKLAFGLEVGFSDHTQGIAVPIAAVARGAVVIEKHFTLDKKLPGPDHQASLEPDELKAMVKAIRQVELALGSGIKMPSPSESKNRAIVRKSLVVARTIGKGEVFTEENLAIKRPGTGASPLYYWELLGKKAARDYATDELVEL